MPTLKIDVKNKIVTGEIVGDDKEIICGNSDYVVNFTFDEEWKNEKIKTMRIRFDVGGYQDVVFQGDSCNLPPLLDVSSVEIGLHAGDLHSTTGAEFKCKKSILCGMDLVIPPPKDPYSQLLKMISDGEIKGEKGDPGEKGEPGDPGTKGEKGDPGEPGKQGEQGVPGEKGDPFTYDDFTEEQLANLKGQDGKDGKDGLNGKDGVDGKNGLDGEKGQDGISATHSWNGTVLTVTSASGTSSADLKGEKGEKGDPGIQGIQGDPGEKGEPGEVTLEQLNEALKSKADKEKDYEPIYETTLTEEREYIELAGLNLLKARVFLDIPAVSANASVYVQVQGQSLGDSFRVGYAYNMVGKTTRLGKIQLIKENGVITTDWSSCEKGTNFGATNSYTGMSSHYKTANNIKSIYIQIASSSVRFPVGTKLTLEGVKA